MDQEQERRIRELAYSLWQSAERPYWIALDYWLMAEKMVLELMIATSKGVKRVRIDPKAHQRTEPRPDANERTSE